MLPPSKEKCFISEMTSGSVNSHLLRRLALKVLCAFMVLRGISDETLGVWGYVRCGDAVALGDERAETSAEGIGGDEGAAMTV